MLGDFIPLLANVLVQVAYAVMNITSKLAMESGMKPLILVAYRQIFATLAIAPFAFFLERKTRPKITKSILFQIFLCSLTGATGNQVFYFVGLENSTATVACALNNVLPAATFVLAALCRQEAVGIKKASGQAKVIGTLVCVGGAMLLSFYHGHIIGIGESSIRWRYADEMTSKTSSSSNGSNFFLGPFLVMVSAVSWAVWFIIQGQTSKNFPAPYTCTALMCFMASIECTIIGIFSDHKLSSWSLSSSIRLIASLYAGIVCNAVAFCLLSWSIQKRGPLYVSVFSPLLLVIVAVLSWALLREKLYVGTLVGSVLIVGGLYAVLWGKDREMKQTKGNDEVGEKVTKGSDKNEQDLELQLHSPPQPKGNQQGGGVVVNECCGGIQGHDGHGFELNQML